ncbi:response regulator transcription factor [Synechococcus sp. Nb3U1]|uniref:two-component system response regulator RppA n=1 Tax=Synechococcus sp. Nb3U1 TaxID=1914529 RepID=UPI001F1DF14D|nr:two-component system response regulator RppA [Synechococcus sp. Nb3U1]MCF2971724.1 response regulator transcription factor [Synechococcus sp. Nb3U1]
MRILLLEDDPEQLEPLQAALQESGHVVDPVREGETAAWLLEEKSYDLLILDWMVPLQSGVQLCRQYRQKKGAAPVLMLTAKDTTQDVVQGLDAGADDYLVKPVDVVELLARVRALGRRSPEWREDTLALGSLQLHLTSLRVERHGQEVQLSGKEFQLMEYLMRHPEQVMSRGQIEQSVWEWGSEPESNAVTALVRRLRLRLKEVEAQEWIESVYGQGYRLRIPPGET